MPDDANESRQIVDLAIEVDKQAFLDGMDALAEEAGDWRDHLPYEAMCTYESDPEVQQFFCEHVEGCAYCQELIDVFSCGAVESVMPSPDPEPLFRRILGFLRAPFLS